MISPPILAMFTHNIEHDAINWKIYRQENGTSKVI